MTKMIEVVLVDENDQKIGLMEKLEAHQKGALHRAISVFIFDKDNRWLLQRRSMGKYHCPGLWSNSCCTHPMDGESYQEAAQRRLTEEMGLSTALTQVMQFVYKADVGNGLTEHEYDTVFVGYSDVEPQINPEEVMEYQWIESYALDDLMIEKPELFTPWFIKLYRRVVHEIQ